MEREMYDKIKIDIVKYTKHSSGEEKDHNQTYPKNYGTCMEFFSILLKIFTTAIRGCFVVPHT